jgi:hypothetical protein
MASRKVSARPAWQSSWELIAPAESPVANARSLVFSPLAPMSQTEPRNPFYLLLLAVSLLFIVTALGYAVVPTLEQYAADRGSPPPPSAWRDALRKDGWIWLLVELGFMALFVILSMGLDRLRSWNKQSADARISQEQGQNLPG